MFKNKDILLHNTLKDNIFAHALTVVLTKYLMENN